MLSFAHARWCSHQGGLPLTLAKSLNLADTSTKHMFSPRQVVTMLFTCNFIGVACARSLHFQFYVWYYHSLPWLLWCTRLPTAFRIILLFTIESCWNPWVGDSSTPSSSVRYHEVFVYSVSCATGPNLTHNGGSRHCLQAAT